MDDTIVQHAQEVQSTTQTTCCIVGGGPAGVMLSFLLARRGISVVLLESHQDFDRDFRGDTLHPSILEVMDELGLAERLLSLPHTKLHRLGVEGGAQFTVGVDFSRLHTRFPYITLMPQAQFLAFLASEAERLPCFQLHMGARVEALIEENGQICGVRYRAQDGWHEVRALLTVGADGRFSRLRRLAGFKPVEIGAPADVLWFRLPRTPDEPQGLLIRPGHDHTLVQLDRGDQWQLGYYITKGTYQQVHAAGLEALRQSILETAPELEKPIAALLDWKQISVLSIKVDRLPRWYRPGLLLIGDAAHVMSPLGGVGINYAIMDAVATANLLHQPLERGQLTIHDLAKVQRRREWPARIMQAIAQRMQNNPATSPSRSRAMASPPLIMRWLAARLMQRLMGFGVLPEHVQSQTSSSSRWLLAGKLIAAIAVVLSFARLLRLLILRGKHK